MYKEIIEINYNITKLMREQTLVHPLKHLTKYRVIKEWWSSFFFLFFHYYHFLGGVGASLFTKNSELPARSLQCSYFPNIIHWDQSLPRCDLPSSPFPLSLSKTTGSEWHEGCFDMVDKRRRERLSFSSVIL